MKIKLMNEILVNYDEIEDFIIRDSFEEIVEIIEKNQKLLEEIRKFETVSEQYSEVEQIKERLRLRNAMVLSRLEKLKEEKKPKLLTMRQKVRASQIYNNMQRNFY